MSPIDIISCYNDSYTFILQASLTFFVLWFSSSEGFCNFYYTSQILTIFQTFEGKSFLEYNPIIIAPNFQIGVKHCVPCVMFLFYHWTRCSKIHHVRPHDFERPRPWAIFLPSIFCRSLSGTAGPLRHRKHLLEPLCKCSTNLPNHRSHSCASSDSLLFSQKSFSWFVLHKPCRLLIGLFRGAVGSFAGLFGVFYYIFLVKAPVKLPKLTICAR